MSSEVIREILKTIEDKVNSTPSAIEFEMAYHARVAIDRIRFAIEHTEEFGLQTDQSREICLQLLDALQRLETVDRQFQVRSRNVEPRFSAIITREPAHRHAGQPPQDRTTNSADGASGGGSSK
jgi:hypothetical protein